MKIDYLGHSEMLINIENENWENIKILSDTWLSDYSVADLMQRNPMITIDWEKLETIDAVFISHAHMDHFDPYTLIKIFSKLKNKPKLLLPETLAYTKELLESELNCDIQILKNKETIQVNWINIQGVIFPDYMNTNEADVMTLCVWNEKEIVFTEVDIVPPDSEDGIAYIYKLFTQKNFQTRLYVATRNELEGNLTIIDLKPEQRKEFYQEYLERRITEMYEHYNNIFALEEEWVKANIYTLPWFVKAFIGQWIIFPAKKLGCDALKLQILALEDEVKYEKQVIEDFGMNFPMYEMNRIIGLEQDFQDKERNLDGKCNYDWLWRYVFENGKLEKVEKIPYLEGEYFKTKQDLDCPCQRELSKEPVMKIENLELEESIKKILDYLNTRFLPYQMWRLDANLKNLALESNGKYIISLKRFVDWKSRILGYFIWELGNIGFRFVEKTNSKYNETYFIEDLINFIDGKIELYSNFWQYLEPGTNIYLWECLWANFINNDIVLKKFKKHFDLAKQGKKPEDFLEKLNIFK